MIGHVSHPASVTLTGPCATAAGAAQTQLSFLHHTLLSVPHCKSPKCPVLIENGGFGWVWAGEGGGEEGRREVDVVHYSQGS